MTGFIGDQEATLDAKGRFLLPAMFRKKLADDEGKLFVINRGFEKCLSLYTLKTFEPLAIKLTSLNDFDPKIREFKRFFLNGATEVELDSAGRILIPKTLMDFAGLSKDIMLVSALNKIEIWDKTKHTEFFETFSPEAFSALAKEVMASDNNPKP